MFMRAKISSRGNAKIFQWIPVLPIAFEMLRGLELLLMNGNMNTLGGRHLIAKSNLLLSSPSMWIQNSIIIAGQMDLPRHNCCNPPKSAPGRGRRKTSNRNLSDVGIMCDSVEQKIWDSAAPNRKLQVFVPLHWRVCNFFFTLKQLPSLEENELKKHLSSLSSLTLSARTFFFPYFPRLGRGLCFWTLGMARIKDLVEDWTSMASCRNNQTMKETLVASSFPWSDA